MRWVTTDKRQFQAQTELELRRLNSVIAYAQQKNGGLPFLGGARFSREDTAIVPLLHFVDVAGRDGMQWHIPDDCKALKVYLQQARSQASFEYPGANDEAVMKRFHALRALEQMRVSSKAQRLADVLE